MDGNSVLHAAHDGNGRFFLNGYKEEYPNCKFPAFNSLKGRWKGAFMNNIFFDEVRRPEGGAEEWF